MCKRLGVDAGSIGYRPTEHTQKVCTGWPDGGGVRAQGRQNVSGLPAVAQSS